jgi:hypothetical protein
VRILMYPSCRSITAPSLCEFGRFVVTGERCLFVDEMELLKALILPFAFTQEIQKVAELQVSSRMLFEMPARTAAPYGCMDARLGISDKVSTCKTCQ